MTSEQWHDGRVAVVTGGNAGIGLAISQALAARGAKVAVGARRCRDADVARGVEEDVGEGAIALPLDVSETLSVEGFWGEVRAILGPPDILVNSAGVSVHQTVTGHSDDDWNAVVDTNLSGPFRMIRACLPGMIEAGWGRIINIASTAAETAVPTHAAYCASKSGLLGLTRAVALEGASHGVTALAVSPTWVETKLMHRSMTILAEEEGQGRSIDEMMEETRKANPQNRIVQVEEIAALAGFLCREEAKGITMEDIQVSAGAFW